MGASTTAPPTTDWVAIATFVLACVTVCAIIVPIVQSNIERHRRKISGLAQLRQVIGFFQQRVDTVLNDLNRRADIYMQGMETMLGRALGEDVGQLFPSMAHATPIYLAMFEGYTAMLHNIEVRGSARLSEPLFRRAAKMLQDAGASVEQQIDELGRESWLKVWFGQ